MSLSFQNVSIKAKVTTAFAFVLAITVGLGLFAQSRLSAVNDAAQEVSENWLPSVSVLSILAAATERYRIIEATLVLAGTEEETTRAIKQRINVLALRDKAWKTYEPLITPGTERALVDIYLREWAAYLETGTKLDTLLRAGKKDEAIHHFLYDMRDSFLKVGDRLKEDVDLNEREGIKAAERGAELYAQTRIMIFGAVGIAMLLAVAAGWTIIANVSKQVIRITETMGRLAKHDLGTVIDGVARKDEIGRMANAVQVFKDAMLEADRLGIEQRGEQEKKEQRQMLIESYVTEFDHSVQEALQTLAQASTEMRSTAEGMAATAEETSRQATAVAAASDQASSNVATVASATEELTSSISEISRQVTQSSDIARKAVAEAEQTNVTVHGLSEAAQKIGDVVKLIQDIASQTNLLALNATIEAARAGDAGKGFAVVASEVKSLANQTAKATEEIAAQISAMQGATEGAVSAIKSIGGTIREIDGITTTIAAAVEQQGGATQEIARNVQEAARGTTEVSNNISGVNRAANDTGNSASHVLAASTDLGGQAEQLRNQVGGFLAKIRAA